MRRWKEEATGEWRGAVREGQDQSMWEKSDELTAAREPGPQDPVSHWYNVIKEQAKIIPEQESQEHADATSDTTTKLFSIEL